MPAEALTYNQAILGLLIIGARADGAFQENEKKLIVFLTSDIHPISTEAYRQVIAMAREIPRERFSEQVIAVLKAGSTQERLEALYWLLKVLKSDNSSNLTAENTSNPGEVHALHLTLSYLNLKFEDLIVYESERDKKIQLP